MDILYPDVMSIINEYKHQLYMADVMKELTQDFGQERFDILIGIRDSWKTWRENFPGWGYTDFWDSWDTGFWRYAPEFLYTIPYEGMDMNNILNKNE